uniref:Uncharacterized protein n=1 Tax=Gouania willdenowi TaxID=441366 RepID=A0A8C5GQT6_GOUWI
MSLFLYLPNFKDLIMKKIEKTNLKHLKPNLNQARKRIQTSKKIENAFIIPENIKTFGKNKKYHIRTYGYNILEADLVILNTCAIRENAEQKVFGEIGFLKKIKRTNPNFIFGVTGCMPQEEKVVEKILEARDVIENLPSVRDHKIKAFVNVMFGCDHFCTYCIVPFTRGKIRSRAKEDILNEVKGLIQEGYKEVTLIGQNVNDYDENILKKMNRTIKINDYIKTINLIRKKINSVAISTDLIVGFPNETDAQFQKTLDLYNLIKFDNAYTFIFSPREGTTAFNMEDNIPIEVKEKRLAELNQLVKKYSR